MKKFFTLIAAVLMAVNVSAQTEETIKFLSGNSDWGQMFVNDGVDYAWPGRTFESSDKLTAKALWAGALLKDTEDKDVTFDRESGTTQTYTIEFGATPTIKLQMCVNCVIPNQYGGGNSTMKYIPLEIADNVVSFTVSADDCYFTGQGYKEVDGQWVADKEYTKEPQNVTSITFQACDQTAGVYPAVVNIKSIKRVTTVATGISKVENLQVAKDGKSFNLAGQQVGKGYKGIVIKNGKKVVIK